MRSLVVTRWMPWPPTSGARHRSANVIAALAGLGDVDVFVLSAEAETGTPPPGVALLGSVVRARRRVGRADRLVTALPWARPAVLRGLAPAHERAAFADVCRDAYDLAWFVRPESWLSLGDLVDAPSVVDLDDLRDHLVRSRFRSPWPAPRPPWSLARWAAVAEAAAWRRIQRRVARAVAAVTVCSELDRGRLAVANSAVVINGVDLPERPAGRAAVRAVPTVLFHGSLNYAPNAEAAELLVREVLPRLRQQLPTVTVRLVGRHDDRVARLAEPPRVTVTGFVADMTTELARCDVVAVPLRQGAGTRIKVLEAMAHRVPVVASSLAVEGLAVDHGRHLLVADDPDTFAAACASLLQQSELRRALADAGEALVRDRYQWPRARVAVSELAVAVAGMRT